MTLFFSLLPFYLFGNLHCMGMCGPLVMLLGQHQYRFFYFLGRLLSFTLAGFLAGELGAIVHLILKPYYLAELACFFCGIGMIGWGMKKLFGLNKPLISIKNSSLSGLHQWVSMLLLKDTSLSTLLFGFFTIALPCGQTLIVFSACALAGNAWIGLFNGFAFALLTTPSLILAMHTLTLFKKCKRYDRMILGCCSILVGLLSCCRGLAEMGWISHIVLNTAASTYYHVVLF